MRDELIIGCTIVLLYEDYLRVRHFSVPTDIADTINDALKQHGLLVARHDFPRPPAA